MEEVKVVKTDKELIQERIDELENNLKNGKSTGRTYKAITKCINALFDNPIGTVIQLSDDPETTDISKIQQVVNRFNSRMHNDFPHINYKIQYKSAGLVEVIRLTETYQETARKRIEQWKTKLNELN